MNRRTAFIECHARVGRIDDIIFPILQRKIGVRLSTAHCGCCPTLVGTRGKNGNDKNNNNSARPAIGEICQLSDPGPYAGRVTTAHFLLSGERFEDDDNHTNSCGFSFEARVSDDTPTKTYVITIIITSQQPLLSGLKLIF